jgi:hypothetical protein
LKTGSYSVLYLVIASLAIVICFVPFLFLGFKKVRMVNTYRVIGIYWLFNGLVNFPILCPIQREGVRNFFQHLSNIYDLVDTPLVLLVFALASAGKLRKQVLLVLVGFVIGESILIGRKGYAFSWPIVIGIGVSLILVYTVSGLWQYLKKMEHNRFENSMAYVYAALLFGYGTYLIIYLLYFFRKSASGYNEADSFLLYYTSLLLSAVVTSTGIWSYGLRRKKPGGSLIPGYSSSSS